MESVKLAFVTKSDADSGNYNTAQRICQGLVSIRPTWSYQIVSTTAETLEDVTNADVLLCLHLYRCASQLGTNGIKLPPMIGIAGGTDLNEDAKVPERRAAMQRFARHCRHIVVFSESLLQSYKQLMSEDLASGAGIPSVSMIPQGISVASLKQDLDQPSDSADEASFQHQDYFIIVGRIRPVKNCCSMLEPFQKWKQRNSDDARLAQVQLLFVGDIEDSEYGEEFISKVADMPDAHLLRGVPHSQALRLMYQSFGLINCSLSEGQSNSVLEAMSLGVPTIVSAVPGNVDLVKHLETGLVYGNKEQLLQCLTLVASDEPTNRFIVQKMVESAQTFVRQSHSVDSELQAYAQLVSECCSLHGVTA